MDRSYQKSDISASDQRRLILQHRSSPRKIAARKLCRRYAISRSHASVIAELQGYGVQNE